MSAEKAVALVVRTTDWSETSRIATLWTREFGKVRVLAKGGRRLKSNFEVALDLLTLCSIVFLRKSSGSLDLLTEAQVVERFPRLRTELPALYAGYYIAELLSDWTEDYDPHPHLFDEALETLRHLGTPEVPTGLRLARFELILLRELGYSPVLDVCAGCGHEVTDPIAQHSPVTAAPLGNVGEKGRGEGGEGRAPEGGQKTQMAFSAATGGMVCPACQVKYRDRKPLSKEAWLLLKDLSRPGEAWPQQPTPAARSEIRQLLNQYVTYLMGRRPRLLPYLGS